MFCGLFCYNLAAESPILIRCRFGLIRCTVFVEIVLAGISTKQSDLVLMATHFGSELSSFGMAFVDFFFEIFSFFFLRVVT